MSTQWKPGMHAVLDEADAVVRILALNHAEPPQAKIISVPDSPDEPPPSQASLDSAPWVAVTELREPEFPAEILLARMNDLILQRRQAVETINGLDTLIDQTQKAYDLLVRYL